MTFIRRVTALIGRTVHNDKLRAGVFEARNQASPWLAILGADAVPHNRA